MTSTKQSEYVDAKIIYNKAKVIHFFFFKKKEPQNE